MKTLIDGVSHWRMGFVSCCNRHTPKRWATKRGRAALKRRLRKEGW